MTDIDHKVLFDAMPVPRFLVEPDESGHYVIREVNARALEYFSRRREHICGKPIIDFMDSENARHFEQAFEVCIKQKVPVTIQALPSFPGGIRVYGFWINPLLDLTGKAVLIDVMAQPDTADDSILQRERDDAISLLTSIFDVSEVAIVVTDHHRRIVRVNDSFIRTFGWKRDDVIGEDFSFLIAPEEQEIAIRNHDRMIESGMRSSGEMRMLRKDGAVANALFTTATLELSQRRRFQVATIMDITLRKQMEVSLRMAKERADAANNAKSAFLANMSHELRTPLNAIIGFSEIMMNETFGKLGSDKYIEYLGDIHLSARHLLEIINEVLDMSKIEAGKVDLDEQPYSIKDLIVSVTRMMTSRAFTSKIDMVTEIPEDLPGVKSDPRLIRQVLINLVSNAIKFSREGGKIDIKAYVRSDGDMVISVEDEGIGIPKEKIREALEPFGQITDSQHAKEQQGTGLGLPLAKAMIELHGGTLSLESDLGKGTKVTVTLPERRLIKPLSPPQSAGKGTSEQSESIAGGANSV
ncbi:MAG: PAS domain-containing sensor histidine kinase [Pseudobdellovibrionaceae bacterium]